LNKVDGIKSEVAPLGEVKGSKVTVPTCSVMVLVDTMSMGIGETLAQESPKSGKHT